MGWPKFSIVIILLCALKCFATSNNELEDFADFLAKTSQLTPSLKQGTTDFDEHHADEVISDNAWEESGKFEGDLILNERQRQLILQNVAEQGLARNGIIDGAKRWPDNELIFAIQVEHFSRDQVQAILSGIDDLARASCVKFRPYRNGDRDAVVIQGNRRGCFSQVGYQGGFQALNLWSRHPVGRGCFRHGTVVHELLHSLGFYHMQSSPDRDDYVDIIWDNIIKSSRHNFRKYNMFTVSDFGVGYDYDSVLHYSRNAFSVNGKATIVPKQQGAMIGQRTGLSDKDTQKLNKMYCDANLDSGQSVDNSSEKNKKKISKNKPFDGHGLGYHKGTAVVFKLLPDAETYKLADAPYSHMFDGFSKSPQILSTPQNENFYIDKKTEYSYKPPALHMKEYKEPTFHNMEHEKVVESEMKPEIQLKDANIENAKNNNDKKLSQESNIELSDKFVAVQDYESSSDFKDALERLTKIIKAHVYPSYTPDLPIYKMDNRHIEQGSTEDEGKNNDNRPLEYVRDSMMKEENAREAFKPNEDFTPKIVTVGYYMEPYEKRSKNLAIEKPEYKIKYGKYLYPVEEKINQDEKISYNNYDRWIHQFMPYKYDAEKDSSSGYLDYMMNHSKGDDNDEKTVKTHY